MASSRYLLVSLTELVLLLLGLLRPYRQRSNVCVITEKNWRELLEGERIIKLWKESDEPLRPVQAKFEFHHGDNEKQILHVLSYKDKTGIGVSNPNQCFSSLTDSTCRLQNTKLQSSIMQHLPLTFHRNSSPIGQLAS